MKTLLSSAKLLPVKLYAVYAAVCTAVILLFHTADISVWVSFMMAVAAVSLVVQTFTLCKMGLRIFSVQYIFLLLMYVFYMGQDLLIFLNYDFGDLAYSVAYTRYGVEPFIASNKYAMVCILLTWLGILVGSAEPDRPPVRKPGLFSNKKLTKTLAFVILAVTVPTELYTTVSKIAVLLTEGYMAARETADILLFQYLSCLFFSAVVMLMAVYADNKRRQKLIFVLFIVYQFFGFLTGARALYAIKIILAIYTYSAFSGNLDLKVILKRYGLFAIALLYALVVVRNFRTEGFSSGMFSLKTNGNLILDVISEFAITTRVITAAVVNTVQPAHGMSLVCSVLSVIPGWTHLFGPELQNNYYTFYALEQQAWGSSFVSDLYFDFGYVGGSIACLVYGVIVGLTCRAFTSSIRNKNYLKTGILSYFLMEIVFSIRSYIFRFPRYFTYYLVILACFCCIAVFVYTWVNRRRGLSSVGQRKKRVVFLCFTPYQLCNSLYYAMMVNWGECEKTLMWVDYAQYNMDLELFRPYFDNIIEIACYTKGSFFERQYKKALFAGRLFACSEAGEYLYRQRQDNVLICFSDEEIVSHKIIEEMKVSDTNQVFIVEEGVHTYEEVMGKEKSLHTKLLNFLLGVKMQPYIGAHSFIRAMIVKKPAMLTEMKSCGREVVLQNNIFADREWVAQLGFLTGKIEEKLNFGGSEKRIIWIGQPLHELGVDPQSELNFIADMARRLRGEMQILIKPHPREDAQKYRALLNEENITLVDLQELSWVPLELFISAIAPQVIVSAFSSAALNVLELGLRARVVFCYKPLQVPVDEKFFAAFSGNIMITNACDLEEVVKAATQPLDTADCQRCKNTNEDLKFLEDSIGRN